MTKTKFRPSGDQIDYLRTVWREKNPEEAARRIQKRKLSQPDFERDADENTSDAPVVTLSDQDAARLKKEMMDLWHFIYNRRHEYLEHRNLEAAALSAEQKKQFKDYILHYEGIPGFTLETENLLIDGLKYPEKDNELANFCYNYLVKKYAKGCKPSETLWIQLWNRDFVPLDAVRLMIRHDNEAGTYSKNDIFTAMFPLLASKVKKHRDKEAVRLAAAQQEEKTSNVSGLAGRRARRLFFLNLLLQLFGYAD